MKLKHCCQSPKYVVFIEELTMSFHDTHWLTLQKRWKTENKAAPKLGILMLLSYIIYSNF